MNFRQLDPGTYGIFPDVSSSTLLGASFVHPGASLGTTVEHYVLFPGFHSPSFDGNGNPNYPMVVKAIAPSVLGEEGYGTGEGGAFVLADFFRAMRAVQDDLGVALRYVYAPCTNSTGVPTSP